MKYLTQTNIRIMLLVISLSLSLWSLVSVGAQTGQTDRLERRIEQLDRRQQGASVDVERRFGALQSEIKVLQADVGAVKDEIGNIKNLGIGIASAVSLLIVQSLWGVIAGRHKPKDH